MACVKLPTPPIPELPAPLSLKAPIPKPPPIPGLPNFCCKLPPVKIPIPPIPIPALVLNPAVIALLNQHIKTVLSYINSLPLNCPLE